jgi:hypothetical protein
VKKTEEPKVKTDDGSENKVENSESVVEDKVSNVEVTAD